MSQFYITLGGPLRSLAEFFCTQSGYFSISKGVFKVNFLVLVVSEILGGPKFTLGALYPLGRPLAEIFCT